MEFEATESASPEPTRIKALLQEAQELTRRMKEAGIIRITFDPMSKADNEIEVWVRIELTKPHRTRFRLNSLEGTPAMTDMQSEWHSELTGLKICNVCGEQAATDADVGAICPAAIPCPTGKLIEVRE